MVRLEKALGFLLLSQTTYGFHNLRQGATLWQPLSRHKQHDGSVFHTRRAVSASSSNPEYTNSGEFLSDAMANAATSVGETLSQEFSDDPDASEVELALRRQTLENRTKTFLVTLPLASIPKSGDSALSIGMVLAQIEKGRILSKDVLVMDDLSFRSSELLASYQGEDTMDESTILRKVENDFQGVVVAAVSKNSAAYKAGVRPGDILKTTSATLGDARWPKSTLEGVRSAVSSRRVSSGSVQLEFQRVGDVADNQFELTLTRPLGLEMKESDDGYVVVTGFTETAPTLVRYAVRPGDRVLAIDSSIGDRLWPVSTVEGVVSAVTTRLPGQQITLRFQRPDANLVGSVPAPMSARAIAEKEKSMSSKETTDLLGRCRGILKRYSSGISGRSSDFVDKYAVRALVADKVVDALANAQSSVDSVTLSMIMDAYISSRQPDGAIKAFEACTGLRADGSSLPAIEKIQSENGNEVVPDTGALDTFTVGSVMKAHAMKNDLDAVVRVLSAAEGRESRPVGDLSSAVWPGTGADGSLRPDTQCYNIAIGAAANSGTESGLALALQMFKNLNSPSKSVEYGSPCRNVVSYNTVIKALARTGRYQQCIDLFSDMLAKKVKPDKFTYTALIPAVVSLRDADFQELLYDMKDRGVEADIVTYNEIIKALCRQRKFGAARKVVVQMEDLGVSPNSMTYGLLMNGLLQAGEPSACLTLFESASSDIRTVGLTENVFLYTTAITAAASIGDDGRAFELLARMKDLNIKPTLKTLTSLMGSCMASKQYSTAVNVFEKIEEPDAYALSQGLRSIALAGSPATALDRLIDFRTKGCAMLGRDLMYAYEVIAECALRLHDFETARETVLDLLGQKNIPSKSMFKAMFNAMNLFPSKFDAPVSEDGSLGADEIEKFRFLLFLIDALAERNLMCEGTLYSAAVTFGSRLRGHSRRIAGLLVKARQAQDQELNSSKSFLMDSQTGEACSSIGWEEFSAKYAVNESEISDVSMLPCLSVRVARKDVPLVLKAEQKVQRFGRRPRVTSR